MSGSFPALTVITPAFNQGRFLAETIDSVLAQNYSNLHYIVIDDGSTDNTSRVLERYAGRLIVVRQENMGETRTVNKGWAMARGDYIAVVNADDPLLPGMLGMMVRFLEERPALLGAYPDWVSIDVSSRPYGPVMRLEYDYVDMLQNCRCLPGPGAVMRRRALELEPARDPRYRYVADFEYWLRLGLHGPLTRVPCLATHRAHPGSATVSRRALVGEELLRMIPEFFERADLPPEIRALQARAVSSVNFTVAAMRRLEGLPYAHYLLQSVRSAPWFGSRVIMRRALSMSGKRCLRWLVPESRRAAG